MKKKEIPRTVLKYLYFDKGLSLRATAISLGISEPTVRDRFKSHGFVPRRQGSWAVKYQKTPFNGNDQEKAYILGFRMGDLNVYMTSETARIIIARTNSTQTDQIELLRTLFSGYGGVKVSGSFKSKNVNCYLDKSFSFLLVDKPYAVDPWIRHNKQNCIAFMAGYIDAEANLIINQGKARFKIDSYDEAILKWMHEWFLNNGIKSKIRLIAKRGEVRYGGGYWNNNLWRLNVNEAHSLHKLCKLVIPYLRHRKRIEDVNKSLMNIMQRKINGTI